MSEESSLGGSRDSRDRRRTGLRFRRVACALLVVVMLFACGGERKSFRKVKRLHANEKYTESLVPLNRAITKDPDNYEAQYLIGVAFQKTGMGNMALVALKKAGEDDKYRGRAGILEATIYLNRGNSAQALATTNRVLDKNPDNLPSLAQRSRARAELGRDLEEGLRDIERVIEGLPDTRLPRVTKASLLLGLDRFDETAGVLAPLEEAWLEGEQVSSRHDLMARWCAVRISLATARNERDAPSGLFGYCLRELDEEPEVRLVLLDYYKAMGDIERVEATLRAALEQRPTNLKARLSLADALRSAGRTSDVRTLLVAGVEMSDGDDRFQLLWTLVEHYEASEDYALAIEALEGAIQLQADPRLPFRLVDLLVLDAQLDLAMEKALELEGQVYVDLGVGRVLLAQGEPREALERFEAGIAVWPDNAGAHYYAAVAAEEIGDIERAIAGYRESVRADPEAADAARDLARLLEGS